MHAQRLHVLQNTDDPYSHDNNFGIWALRWSSDGQQILAGTGDESLYLYDLASNRVRAAHRLAVALCSIGGGTWYGTKAVERVGSGASRSGCQGVQLKLSDHSRWLTRWVRTRSMALWGLQPLWTIHTQPYMRVLWL